MLLGICMLRHKFHGDCHNCTDATSIFQSISIDQSNIFSRSLLKHEVVLGVFWTFSLSLISLSLFFSIDFRKRSCVVPFVCKMWISACKLCQYLFHWSGRFMVLEFYRSENGGHLKCQSSVISKLILDPLRYHWLCGWSAHGSDQNWSDQQFDSCQVVSASENSFKLFWPSASFQKKKKKKKKKNRLIKAQVLLWRKRLSQAMNGCRPQWGEFANAPWF